MDSTTFGSNEEAQILLELSNKHKKTKAVSRILGKYNRRLNEVVNSNLTDKRFHLDLLLKHQTKTVEKLKWTQRIKDFLKNVIKIRFRNYIDKI